MRTIVYEMKCTGLTPIAIAAPIVSLVARNWWYAIFCAACVAFDLRFSKKLTEPQP